MTSVLQLKEIKKLDLGIDLAVVELHLANPSSLCTGTFIIESTGMSFKLVSSHHSDELFMLADWLREDSSNDNNLRTNRAEIIFFAKDKIKTKRLLDKHLSL